MSAAALIKMLSTVFVQSFAQMAKTTASVWLAVVFYTFCLFGLKKQVLLQSYNFQKNIHAIVA